VIGSIEEYVDPELTDTALLAVSSMVLLLVNYLLIPCLIDYFSYFLNFRLKSERHYSNFWKNYLYLLINVLIIPLFGLTNYQSLFYFLILNDSYTITNLAMTKSTLFTKFMLSLTLMSNGLYALDAPH